ncbi:MAG: zinc ribbon domain-containing protein [Acidimicrobiales bacterium]
MAWNDRRDWIWSAELTHEPLVTPELFAAASSQRSIGEHRQATVKPRRRNHYGLSSLVRCGICDRRMSGAWSHGQAYHRCTWPSEYAGAARKHERGVHLRETDITTALDEWLLTVFDPDNLDGAVAALAAAQAPDDASAARTRQLDAPWLSAILGSQGTGRRGNRAPIRRSLPGGPVRSRRGGS